MGILNVKNRECRDIEERVEIKRNQCSFQFEIYPMEWIGCHQIEITLLDLMIVLCAVDCLFVYDVMQIQCVNVYCSIFWMENGYVMFPLSARNECLNYVMLIMINRPSWAL